MIRWCWQGSWLVLALVGCATAATEPDPKGTLTELTPETQLSAPPPGPVSADDALAVAHGRYLVELLGCGSCHTDGALIGAPSMDRQLAGSRVGIAYSNPLEVDRPGVVYGANLTPDPETGIGNWTVEELVDVVRTGLDRHGRQQLSVMPWPVYSRMSDDDAQAIATYLKSLEPVRHEVPDRVEPGQRAPAPYIHFGVYTYDKD